MATISDAEGVRRGTSLEMPIERQHRTAQTFRYGHERCIRESDLVLAVAAGNRGGPREVRVRDAFAQEHAFCDLFQETPLRRWAEPV